MMSDTSPSSPTGSASDARSFPVRVVRQDGPGQPSYWEEHRVEHENDMNCISVLQKIAEKSTTADGRRVAPVVCESK